MVCIAAFIILAVIGLFVAIISIFKREVGKTYLKMMKKALGCVSKKVRLQKCETGFKEDVKNTVLSKVIIKHPKWVKPLSIIMEIVSVIIVVVTVWALLTAIKSLLALWTLGTCNVTKPSACTMTSEQCDLSGEKEPSNILEATGRWFTEWGDIFGAIPDKFRNWNPEQFALKTINVKNENQDAPIAVDILDPGCSACYKSYNNQKDSGFMEKYNLKIVVLPIQSSEGDYKFKNSETIARYIYAAQTISDDLSVYILDGVFTRKKEYEDKHTEIYQNVFNTKIDKEKTISTLDQWAKEYNVPEEDINKIHERMNSEDVTNILKNNYKIVQEEIRAIGIPTMLYDGGRHTGLYEN
ncbi:MAG: hypothetical protein K6G36_02560 [Candidatus Saccharibacteria bacterium]|nr:hypothetical protein [Candidatus Saccharibacteria bacterium]